MWTEFYFKFIVLKNGVGLLRSIQIGCDDLVTEITLFYENAEVCNKFSFISVLALIFSSTKKWAPVIQLKGFEHIPFHIPHTHCSSFLRQFGFQSRRHLPFCHYVSSGPAVLSRRVRRINVTLKKMLPFPVSSRFGRFSFGHADV